MRTPIAPSGSYVIHRKDLFRRYRDHLQGKNETDKLVTHKMGQYVRNTSHFSALFESPQQRSSSIEDASREIERQNTKFTRMKQEMDTLTAYRSELEGKKQLINEYSERYGKFFLQLVDAERDMLNLSLDQLRQKYIPLAESARLHVNAMKIQSFWRRRKLLQQTVERYQRVREAIIRLQRFFREFLRLRGPNPEERRLHAATIQKYLRGHLARQRVMHMLKFDVLKPSLSFLDEFRRRAYEDSQIKIAYQVRRYLKRMVEKES